MKHQLVRRIDQRRSVSLFFSSIKFLDRFFFTVENPPHYYLSSLRYQHCCNVALLPCLQWFEGVQCCRESDSLFAVVEAIVRAEVHRLIVTDADKKVRNREFFDIDILLSFLCSNEENVVTFSPFLYY